MLIKKYSNEIFFFVLGSLFTYKLTKEESPPLLDMIEAKVKITSKELSFNLNKQCKKIYRLKIKPINMDGLCTINCLGCERDEEVKFNLREGFNQAYIRKGDIKRLDFTLSEFKENKELDITIII